MDKKTYDFNVAILSRYKVNQNVEVITLVDEKSGRVKREFGVIVGFRVNCFGFMVVRVNKFTDATAGEFIEVFESKEQYLRIL